MKHTPSHRLVSLLLLAAFCLGQTLLGALAVRCTDASGESRIEIVCSRSDEGACMDGGDADRDAMGHEEGGSGDQKPCRDEPIGQAACRAKLIQQPAPFDPIAVEAAPMPPWVAASDSECSTARAWAAPPTHERPPDAAALLSTVILIV